MLTIGIDGRSHDGQFEKDLARQRRLELLGIRVLRFSDQEVMREMDNVLRAIEGWIEDR